MSHSSLQLDYHSTTSIPQQQRQQQYITEPEDEIDEPITQNAEIVLFLARGVGALVAIVAILLCLMIMMIARALISFMLRKFGITVVVLLISSLVLGAMKYRDMRSKAIITILNNSCS